MPQNRLAVVAAAFAAAFFGLLVGCLGIPAARAQDVTTNSPPSNLVSGVFMTTPNATPLANRKYDSIHLNSRGWLGAVGPIANGAAADALNGPVLVGGWDGANVRTLLTSATGALVTGSSPIPAVIPVPSGVITSNGAVAVPIVAAVGGQRVYVFGGEIGNFGTVKHTVDVFSSGGTILGHFPLLPGGAYGIDLTRYWITSAAEGLSFSFSDGTGAAGDLTATISYVQQ